MKKLLIFVGVIVAFCLYSIISNEMELRAMANVEGRQEFIADIAEKYEGAVITSEKEVEGYIHFVGILLLFAFMIVISLKDIWSIFTR